MFLVWVMCLCFVIIEAFLSILTLWLWASKDCIQAAIWWLDGRKWRVLPYLLSSLQFLVWYGEMKMYSHLLWVIMQYKQGLYSPFFPLVKSITAWNVLCVGYHLSIDVLGSQASSVTQASWTNRGQQQRYLEDGVLSLVGIEKAAAECRFSC